MDPLLLDRYLAPALVPTIFAINVYKQVKEKEADLLYVTVGFGIILTAIYGSVQYKLRTLVRSRRELTLIIAGLGTIFSLIAIIGFHIIRINIDSYTSLPKSIHSTASDIGGLRYHFPADFIPGTIIFSSCILYYLIMFELLQRTRRTFTIGEASIVGQLATSAYLTFALVSYTRVTGAGPYKMSLPMEIVLSIGMITSFTMTLAYYWLSGRATIRRYLMIVSSLVVSYAFVNNLIGSTNPIKWLVDHIFSTHQRISLFSLWLSTVAACISFSTSWARAAGQTNSLVRKVFHLAICVVFISGYNQDLSFTRFAAGGMTVAMILLETIRASNLKYIGSHIEKVCKSLRGGWDNKYLTLSHIYLHLGIFIPLWILPTGTNKLPLSAGLIAVGVGDSAAAIVGTFLGRTKLSQSSGKTMEGLLGNFLAMFIFKMFWIGHVSFIDEYSFVLAAIATAFMEAVITTCDNLILPLVMILVLEIF